MSLVSRSPASSSALQPIWIFSEDAGKTDYNIASLPPGDGRYGKVPESPRIAASDNPAMKVAVCSIAVTIIAV
jgi:hypothetical protein